MWRYDGATTPPGETMMREDLELLRSIHHMVDDTADSGSCTSSFTAVAVAVIGDGFKDVGTTANDHEYLHPCQLTRVPMCSVSHNRIPPQLPREPGDPGRLGRSGIRPRTVR